MSDVVLPRLGWSMDEGVFRGWLKRDGESVRTGEPLFTVEGDKAVQEVEAIADGVLRITPGGPNEGDTIPVGTVLGRIEAAGATPQPAASRSTPRARRAAREQGVDITRVKGTGRNGRVRERDVLALAPRTTTAPAEPSPHRKATAQRVAHSFRSTVPVTLTTTADATNLVNLREQFKTDGLKPVPSYTDLFIKLAALALRKHPAVNARWQDERLVTTPDVHIGFAVETEAGLFVPVVRGVPTLTLRQLGAQTQALIERAHAGRLTPAELQGGTFTITNLGAYGIDAFTPVINWPECAILGVGAIRPQPVAVDRQVVIREIITLSLTVDHRVLDGAPAARFLTTLREAIENAPTHVE